MASLLLTVAGSAIGNALLPGIGGPLLASVGAAVGANIDQAIFGTSTIKGPRLEQLKVQDSTYGNGIPIIYGRARVAGQVIWASDFIETLSRDEVGGKGGGGSQSLERASYVLHCAVAIGTAPLSAGQLRIVTIWADSKVIYANGQWREGIISDAEFYGGSVKQNPSPIMQAHLGAENVPAYRGLAYVVLENFQLAPFGQRLPNLTFEVEPPAPSPNPLWKGDVLPGLIVCPDSLSNPSALPPIVIARRGNDAARILCAGITQTGSAFNFVAIEYDVTGDVPVEINRQQSASVTRPGNIYDLSWAISHDAARMVFYMQHLDAGNPIALAIYHIQQRQFGTMCTHHLSAVMPWQQIIWLDALRFMIADTSAGRTGVRIFVAQGQSVVPLGFYDVWGAGSSSNRFMQPFSQFASVTGGVICLAANASTSPSTVYARILLWRDNQLIVGAERLISHTLTGFTALRTAFLALGQNHFLFARWNFNSLRVMTFHANYGAVNITRAWATIDFAANGDIMLGIKNGQLVVISLPFSSGQYQYTDIILTASGFSVGATQNIIGIYSGSFPYFNFCVIDGARFLLIACGSGGEFDRVGIFERNNNKSTLDSVVADIFQRAGYISADYNFGALSGQMIDGYVLAEPLSARGAIEPLQIAHAFDLIESDGLIKAKNYTSTADMTIASNDTRSVLGDGENPPLITTTRAQEIDLPAQITLDYIDPARDYQRGSQRAKRIAVIGRTVQNMSLPIICSANKAKQIAEDQLTRAWAQRDVQRFSISRRYMVLDAGDVVLHAGRLIRLTRIQQAGDLMDMEGVPVAQNLSSTQPLAETGIDFDRRPIGIVPSYFYMMDLPLLRNADNQAGYYVGFSGAAGWTGGALYRANDDNHFSLQQTFTLPLSAGCATNLLGSASPAVMDYKNTLTISMMRGSLSSCTRNDLLNGANAALCGHEIIQFEQASLNADGSYSLQGLLRGVRGSEYAIGTHQIGERFVLLQPDMMQFMPLQLSDRARSFYFRGGSVGEDVATLASMLFTPQLKTLEPFAPVHVRGARDGAGAITISWIRRARLYAGWVDQIDVPLDEDSENYEIDIMNGAAVVRQLSGLSSTSATYSAAQQISDFGALQPSVVVKIYQIGTIYGRGQAAQATI